MLEKKPNNEQKLEAIYEMTLENNEILRTIRRQQYFANALRVLYWLVILGAIGSAYYFVRPVVSALSSNSSKLEEAYTQFRGQLPETKLIEKVINDIRSKNAVNTDNQMPDNGVIDSVNTVNP